MLRRFTLIVLSILIGCASAYGQFDDVEKMRSDEPPPPSIMESSSDTAPSETAEEEEEEEEGGEEEEKKDKAPENTKPKAVMGLFLGQIAAIDKQGRYLFIKPSKQHEGPRQTFYIDKQTIYRRDHKNATLDEFRNGENVGIRYIQYNGIFLAAGVFYIEGDEVNLADVKMPPSYKR
jgi:hypothetical protein